MGFHWLVTATLELKWVPVRRSDLHEPAPEIRIDSRPSSALPPQREVEVDIDLRDILEQLRPVLGMPLTQEDLADDINVDDVTNLVAKAIDSLAVMKACSSLLANRGYALPDDSKRELVRMIRRRSKDLQDAALKLSST